MLAAAAKRPSGEARPDQGRRVVLLSLFDGMGTARQAVDDMLRVLRRAEALVGSFFAETDAQLGDAVQP
eukprot:10423982-Lingulodinium_polyedra.AAC.1